MSHDLIIRGGRVVDPSQDLDAVRDLVVRDGEVAEIGEGLEVGEDFESYDATGLVVAPGLIDIHVHLREPGFEYKETIETGSRSAAAGGFTAIACMPNTDPVIDNRSVVSHIVRSAREAGYSRVYPIGAISKGQAGEELAEYGELVKAGIVALSDDGYPVMNAELMRRCLEYAQHYDLPVIQHAEDTNLSGGGVMHEGEWSTRLGLPGFSGLAEDVMVNRDILLAEATGGRYHVAHISTARSLKAVRRAKEDGLHNVTCEVCPHHFILTDQDVADSAFSTNFKMSPPLRSRADRDAMIQGLVDGTIEAIGSDHAPHHADEKDVEFSRAPNGIVGLETTVSLCLDRLVKPGVISLSRLIDLLSTGPARLLSLPGGSLAVGSPADVSILSLDAEVTVDAKNFESKGANTPFDGWKLTGGPVTTFLAGRKIDLG